MKFVFLLLILLTSQLSVSEAVSEYHFTIQSVYNNEITINVIGNIFGDLNKLTGKEVRLHAMERFDQLNNHLEEYDTDLILWGYSKSFDLALQKQGYRPILSTPFITYLYEYTHLNRKHHNPIKIGVLTDSSALYTAMHHFKEVDQEVEYLKYDNYFELIQACFRKEFDLIAATPSFLLPQPVDVQNRFKVISKLPAISSVTIWAKQSISDDSHQNYFDYFSSKQDILGKYVGTGDFKKVELP